MKYSPETQPNPENPAIAPNARWSQDRRLEFIDFRLQWDGHVNRSDLTLFFGISVPQASLDFSRYLTLAPGNMEYDRSSRLYVALPSFKPIYAASHPNRYLNELLAIVTGVLPRQESFVGWYPPLDTVPLPTRTLDADILTVLLRAIRHRQSVRVLYQSTSKPEPTSRTLSPHAIAHDGFRWHVRAYCDSRKQFLDFVIARILRIDSTEPSGADPEQDREWQNILRLVLEPNPNLSPALRRALELDYGMEGGEVELPCREALLFYELKRLGLLEALRNGASENQQIVLKNEAEIREYLQKFVPDQRSPQ